MKFVLALFFIFIASTVATAQNCNIPSLRGLKLGMTASAIDSLFVVEDDKIYFDDATYTLTFTREKLVKIIAVYPAVKDQTIKEFIAAFSEKTGLPNNWDRLADSEKLAELKAKRADLLTRYTREYVEIKLLDEQINQLSNSKPILRCGAFSVTAEIGSFPVVTLRLTNRNNSKNNEFKP